MTQFQRIGLDKRSNVANLALHQALSDGHLKALLHRLDHQREHLVAETIVALVYALSDTHAQLDQVKAALRDLHEGRAGVMPKDHEHAMLFLKLAKLYADNNNVIPIPRREDKSGKVR